MRKIPATMATQHPDNANAPYWSDSPAISTLDEVEECYRVFADLDIDEYMWDWEGKFVDEAVIDRLFNKYSAFFHKKQIGRDKFLTYRIPNIWHEHGVRLARSFMTMLTAAQSARDFSVHAPPIFELILPMTTSAKQLITILQKFRRAAKYEKTIFESQAMDPDKVEIIPLIEGSATLLESAPILKTYAKSYEKEIGHKPAYIRPFIARSDPALDAGSIAATLSARGAISEYYRFEEDCGIRVFPIMGAGAVGFRGGLSPDRLERFIALYGGIRTVTLQSAFRYDYPREDVDWAVRTLKRKLPDTKPVRFNDADTKTVMTLTKLFAKHYRPLVTSLAGTINDLAAFIPKHRERIPHTGHFGYSRKVGKSSVQLPRAITFGATLYSLGIPPEFIGTGHGLKATQKLGLEKDLLKLYPGLEDDLLHSGRLLNWENLKFLAKKDANWNAIWNDVKIIEEFLGKRLEPQTSDQFIHRNLTSNIFHFWRDQRAEELKADILNAAKVRRGLG